MPMTREEFFATENLAPKTEPVPVPELAPGKPLEQAYVLVRQVTAGEKQQWEESLPDAPKGSLRTPNFREHAVVYFTVDENGKQIFTPSDVMRLSRLPNGAQAIERICDKAMALNGVTTRDREELEKNFEKARLSAKSCSDSPLESASTK